MTKDFEEFFDGLNDIMRSGFTAESDAAPEPEETPRLTKRQAAIVGTYTGYVCGPFQDIHEYIEEILGRPVWTHELGLEEVQEEVTNKSRPDYIALQYLADEEAHDD